jgi:hypothetical protein
MRLSITTHHSITVSPKVLMSLESQKCGQVTKCDTDHATLTTENALDSLLENKIQRSMQMYNPYQIFTDCCFSFFLISKT